MGRLAHISHSANADWARLRKICTKVVVSFQANATTNGAVIACENELMEQLTWISRGFYSTLYLVSSFIEFWNGVALR